MKKAIRIAEKARGTCSPNPFVGAVIVKDDVILATGCTQSYGSDHAEVNALKKAGLNASGADMYVSLEPCSHYGKTPPCALAIIASGIRRVYIGIQDPNPLVSGKGMQMLQDAGIEVHSGILEAQIRRQLEYYLCYISNGRPFVALKTALSLDGKFAAADGSARWISGELARRHTHKLRSEYDVILAGIKTVLADDPMLNSRLPNSARQPLRVILDTLLQLPLSGKIAQSAGEYPTLLFCSVEAEQSTKAKELIAMGMQLKTLPVHNGHFRLIEVLRHLATLKHYSVLIESGSGLSEAFIKDKLVDKFLFFYGAKILGGPNSPLLNLGLSNISDAIKLSDISFKKLGDNFLLSGYPVW